MRYLLYATLLGCLCMMTACTPTASNGSDNGSYGNAAEPEGTKLYFQTIEQRAMSGIDNKEEHIVSDDKQWATLWAKVHSNQSPVPNMQAVNFNKEQVLAVFMGQKNSGGYGIEIKRVIDTGKKIVVVVEEITPPEGAIVTMALTQPFHIVKIENPDGKPIVFK